MLSEAMALEARPRLPAIVDAPAYSEAGAEDAVQVVAEGAAAEEAAVADEENVNREVSNNEQLH